MASDLIGSLQKCAYENGVNLARWDWAPGSYTRLIKAITSGNFLNLSVSLSTVRWE